LPLIIKNFFLSSFDIFDIIREKLSDDWEVIAISMGI